MAAEKGRSFVLKLGDGANPEVFTVIAGMRATQLVCNNEVVDITNKQSSGWRELLANAGVRTVSLSGSGIFTNSATELSLQASALAGSIANYEITFESGDKFSGAFLITSLGYAGDYAGERTYTLALESSGPVSFTPV